MDLPNQSSNSNGNQNPLIPDQQQEIAVQNNATKTTTNTTNHLPVESGQDESTFPNHPSFPSIYECPITQEPPAVGATFMDHDHVFEYSALYRHIAARGANQAFRNVLHPLSRQSIPRVHALNAVHLVSQEIQTMINEERQRRGLSCTDSNPINEEDRARYESTMRAVQDE